MVGSKAHKKHRGLSALVTCTNWWVMTVRHPTTLRIALWPMWSVNVRPGGKWVACVWFLMVEVWKKVVSGNPWDWWGVKMGIIFVMIESKGGEERGFTENSSHVVLWLQLQPPFALSQGPVKFPMLFAERTSISGLSRLQLELPRTEVVSWLKNQTTHHFFKGFCGLIFGGVSGAPHFWDTSKPVILSETPPSPQQWRVENMDLQEVKTNKRSEWRHELVSVWGM